MYFGKFVLTPDDKRFLAGGQLPHVSVVAAATKQPL